MKFKLNIYINIFIIDYMDLMDNFNEIEKKI